MAPEKVTTMVLTVDLKCARCYKKVKKVLCKFPQIRDQIYNEKNNTVKIKVVCCSPEKIREKLCIKGRKSIQRIEIMEPQPPKPPPPAPAPDSEPQKPPKPDPPPPPPPSEKPIDKPPPPDPAPEKPPDKEKPESESKPKPPTPDPPKEPAPPPQPPHPPPLIAIYPPPPGIHVCCQDCYEGRPGGPCYGNYYTNRPGPCEPPFRPPVSGGYYYGGWPSSQNSYHPGYCYPPSRGYCFNEENPQSCIIM